MVSRRDQIIGVSAPTGLYSLMSIVEPNRGLAWISGQTGRRPDDTMPDSAYHQTLGAFQALGAIIEEVQALPSDIVHLRTFLIHRSDLADFARAREETFSRWFPDTAPSTNTLVFVTGLVDPRALVEIEGVVAAPAKI